MMSEVENTQPPENETASSRDTFCVYLAQQFITKKGFSVGTVPEARELVTHSDIVLSRLDGYTLTIVCMIDRETHPGKIFTLSPYAVEDIGQACLKYTGKISRNKMPVTIQIFEVGPASADQQQRLRVFTRPSLFSKIIPSAWIVDTASASVWTNAGFGGLLSGRRFIEQLLHSPRETDVDLRPVVSSRFGFPYLTAVILAILCAVFVVEIAYGIGQWSKLLQPTITTLVAFGGLTRSLVLQSGEWYRLFSAPLLHGDAGHLVMNAIALFLAGFALESLIGRAWFATIFVVGAVSGSLLSLALNVETIVSVGASGAVMGLFAAMLMVSYHFPPSAKRTSLQMSAVYVLIPSLLPLTSILKGQKVDYAAHFGGALGGIAVALLLLAIWRRTEVQPRLQAAALIVALVGCVAFIYPAYPVTRNYSAVMLSAKFIPQTKMPQSDAAAKAQSANLVAQYPRDPRARLMRAAALLDSNDTTGAERELRAGLAEEGSWRRLFPADLSTRLRTMLAFVLARDRVNEAKVVARPVCESVQSGPSRDLLRQLKLCEN